MPYNVLGFVSRKPGITPAAFQAHYEETHMPLLKTMAGDLFPTTHTRHYLKLNEDDSPMVLVGDKATLDYDAVAELSFDDQAAFQAYLGFVMAEKKISADSDKFIDQTNMRLVVIGDVKVTSK